MAAQLLNAMLRIPIDQVHAGPNARGDLGDVSELAASLRAIGMQQPILVCQDGTDRYEVIEGHRRLAAARLLAWPYVDAVLRRATEPATRVVQQLAMHTQARQFDPIAEAKALHSLMWEHRMDRGEIARAIGRSPEWVRDRVLLLQLDTGRQQAVSSGRLSVGAAVLEARLVVDRKAGREPRPYVRAVGAPPAPPAVRTAVATVDRHCPTCTCGGGA